MIYKKSFTEYPNNQANQKGRCIQIHFSIKWKHSEFEPRFTESTAHNDYLLCDPSRAQLNSLILTFSILIDCHHLSPSYLLGGSLAVVMVLTSSTAELKSLIFSEEYSPDGLLYWLVTTLEPKPVKGRALLLWVEPMCFTSCKNQAAKVRRVQYI